MKNRYLIPELKGRILSPDEFYAGLEVIFPSLGHIEHLPNGRLNDEIVDVPIATLEQELRTYFQAHGLSDVSVHARASFSLGRKFRKAVGPIYAFILLWALDDWLPDRRQLARYTIH